MIRRARRPSGLFNAPSFPRLKESIKNPTLLGFGLVRRPRRMTKIILCLPIPPPRAADNANETWEIFSFCHFFPSGAGGLLGALVGRIALVT